jgi:hypothetical protein
MTDNEGGGGGAAGRGPDPFVAARISDPATPPTPTVSLTGLFGDSDRADRKRLYLNTRLDYYVEFRTADVIAIDSISPDQPPFLGLDATRVTLARDARVDYVRSQVDPEVDQFALDVRGGAVMPSFAVSDDDQCPTGFTVCKPLQCRFTENNRATCQTCQTDCNAATCDGTCQTCQTNCNQATCGGTCQTCQTNCNQATCGGTCQTCQTNCNQATCFGTCRPNCTFAQTHCNTCWCER